MTNTYTAFDKICDGKSNMEDLSKDARIILKWFFKNKCVQTQFSWFRIGSNTHFLPDTG
jgi:hypothetical protein